jgi:hypothetical protein
VLQALLTAMNADLSILQQFMDLSRSFQGGDISSYVLSPTSAEQEEMAFRRMETALQRWLGTLRSRVLTDVRERRRAG